MSTNTQYTNTNDTTNTPLLLTGRREFKLSANKPLVLQLPEASQRFNAPNRSLFNAGPSTCRITMKGLMHTEHHLIGSGGELPMPRTGCQVTIETVGKLAAELVYNDWAAR
jgi:hypothetical protein